MMASRSTAVTVRPARTDDANALFGLVQELAVTYKPTRETFDRSLPKLLGSDHQLMVVAETDGGDVAGYAMAAESMTLYANGPTTELIELVIEEPHRGEGVGRALVDAVIDWARKRGCIEVNVPSRRAGPFYIGLGFENAAPRYRLKL